VRRACHSSTAAEAAWHPERIFGDKVIENRGLGTGSRWFSAVRCRRPAATDNGRRTTDPVRVYPLPPQLPTNPYLDQLYAPMVDQGVDVRRVRPRYVIPELLLGRGRRILHLHFFDELTQRRSAFQTIVRSLLFLALLLLLRLRGVRLVWTAHNLKPHETHHPFWAFLVYRMVARWSSAIIAHSESARSMLEARYGPLPRCAVIPIGNYIGLYGPLRDRSASRAALGLPHEGRVLLYLGALRPY
jgi:beta-1,4-mannosyltransferase